MKRWLVILDSLLIALNLGFAVYNLLYGHWWMALVSIAACAFIGWALWSYIRTVRRQAKLNRLYREAVLEAELYGQSRNVRVVKGNGTPHG